MVACLGIDPRNSPPRVDVALQTLCHAMEIPPLHAIAFVDSLGNALTPLAQALTDSETFLRPQPHIEKLIEILKTSVQSISKTTAADMVKVGSEWFSSKLRVDMDSFLELMEFAMGSLQRRTYPAGMRHAALHEIDAFCDSLIEIAPEAFSRALAELFQENSKVDTPQAARRQQAHMQPLYHLIEAARHQEAGKQNSAIIARFNAWRDAAESSIYTISKFVCTLRSSESPKRSVVAKGKEGTKRKNRPKGDEFKLALEWCDDKGLVMPFRKDTYKLRNAVAHTDSSIQEKEVLFFDEDGTHLAAISTDDIVALIEHDVLLAANFSQALVEAYFRHQNRLGRFDDAWATAKSCIPHLEAMTLDDGARWPNHAETSKRRRRKTTAPEVPPLRDRYSKI